MSIQQAKVKLTGLRDRPLVMNGRTFSLNEYQKFVIEFINGTIDAALCRFFEIDPADTAAVQRARESLATLDVMFDELEDDHDEGD